MKKLFILFFLAVSLVCFGQNKNYLADVSSINFYGVDYSAAKVFGAAESPTDFIDVFRRINELFIIEAKKYDVGKRLNMKVRQIQLNAANKVNSEIDPAQLMIATTEYTLTEEEIKQTVDALPIQPEPGIGLVIIAKFLNKAEAYGTYQAVFFNTETKKIIHEYPIGGKARGIGLRNYWAGSIYQALNRL